jgi:hypothetical protein
MQLIQHITLSSNNNTISFLDIPQDGTDLVVEVRGRNSTTNSNFGMRFNSVDADYFSATVDASINTSTGNAFTAGNTQSAISGLISRSDTASEQFGSTKFYVFNYSNTSFKTVNIEASTDWANANNEINARAGMGYLDRSTPITRIDLISTGGNFVANSSATLYKITKGSTPGVIIS